MIKINDHFSFERDKYQWVLTETIYGFNNKTQKPCINIHKTFHSTIDQICQVVLNHSLIGCETLESIRLAVNQAKQEISEMIKGIKVNE